MNQESDSLCQLLTTHLARYPQMQVQDLYKLLHQAALGSGHAVHDAQAVRSWLDREQKEMGSGPEEPLIDPLSPNGQIARLHLRPYLAAGKDPEVLLQAFIRTANEWRGSAETLRASGQAAARLAEIGNWPIRRVEIETFFATMEVQGFPAAHHSELYGRLYRPAYRVVAARFLEDL